jgi:hypothetical protein
MVILLQPLAACFWPLASATPYITGRVTRFSGVMILVSKNRREPESRAVTEKARVASIEKPVACYSQPSEAQQRRTDKE